MGALEHIKETLVLVALLLLKDILSRIIFSFLQNSNLSLKVVKVF